MHISLAFLGLSFFYLNAMPYITQLLHLRARFIPPRQKSLSNMSLPLLLQVERRAEVVPLREGRHLMGLLGRNGHQRQEPGDGRNGLRGHS